MPVSVRYYTTVFIQIVSSLLLAVYLYVSFPAAYMNVYWFLLALGLLAYGIFRGSPESLIVGGGAVLLYGLFVLYRLFLNDPAMTAGWNDLVWLIVFPLFAAIGSIGHKSNYAQATPSYSFFDIDAIAASGQKGPALVDERFGFLSSTAFLYKLEEEVLVALRDRQKFVLQLIEIENLPDYKRFFGSEQTEVLLNFIAEWLTEMTTDSKAQVGENVLACLLYLPEPAQLAEFRERLDQRFYEMLLTRPRRESTVRLKLKYASSECPADGIEAKMLLEKARNDLSWSATQ